MDDGTKSKNGLKLSTESFQLNEIEKLREILKQKFNLETTIHKSNKTQYVIYIRTKSMDLLKEIVKPHFHKIFYYKLG